MVLARRTPLKRTPKKRSKVNATTRADVEFSRLIRARDKWCLRCGTVEWLECAHVWSRRYFALRWKFENAITLCRGCHHYFTVRPAEWAVWCEERLFCADGGICKGERCEGQAFTYQGLRERALNDPPEKAADALVRLKAASHV